MRAYIFSNFEPMMKRIYFDYSASTPIDASVRDRMLRYFCEDFGNPSSVHGFGREARVAIDTAREQVAHVLNASPSEIVFTSGGTEADNLALFGIAGNFSEPRHLITSAIEHPAVLNTCKTLERKGWALTFIKPNLRGRTETDVVEKEIRPDTALISIMHVNNETGVINPISEIAELAASRGISFHTDAVQSFGKLAIDVKRIPVTLLSFSSHKIYGPKGAGGLYVRAGTKLSPVLYGGHQERDRRAGTENTAAIVGLGYAAELAAGRMEQDRAHLSNFSEYFWGKLKSVWPVVELNGHRIERLPGILNLSFMILDSVVLATRLDVDGIAVSNGSACSSGSPEPSKVLETMGLARERSTTALRISFGRPTTTTEIDQAIEVFRKIYSTASAPRKTA
jgi:cysteine desulfurase